MSESIKYTVALAGNPNVGKSTVFNALTGLHQHTGNWPGKTVSHAEGEYSYGGNSYRVIDLPGAYSLAANSADEEATRDNLCFGAYDALVIVVDATCLERNLIFFFSIMDLAPQALLCVNLLDEAKKKHINLDLHRLEQLTGIPVIGTAARDGKGVEELQDSIARLCAKRQQSPQKVDYGCYLEQEISALEEIVNPLIPERMSSRWCAIQLLANEQNAISALEQRINHPIKNDPLIKSALANSLANLAQAGISRQDIPDLISSATAKMAEKTAGSVVSFQRSDYTRNDRRLDRIFTSRITGIPVMLLLLAVIFWITIRGANYPSALLSSAFVNMEELLADLLVNSSLPVAVQNCLTEGVFRTLGWVIAVMLPPMAIFFPLFSLLEDSGYLPRVAFNLDKYFRKSGAHGKQALTMCMGFGCNACGVCGCRIIDSPRERLVAMLTNTFVPCNGRFPAIIALITIFFVPATGIMSGIMPAIMLTTFIVFSIAMTFLVSKILSKTMLKGVSSSFSLELPPYRRPKFLSTIVRSVCDRVIFVLGRAIVVAAPAGLILWILANIPYQDSNVLVALTNFLDPFATFFGLDGVILLAFILGFPANETVLPIMLMGYLAGNSLMDVESTANLATILKDNGWTWLTALNTILFYLLHFPCATTCLTIKKESGSFRWMLAAIIIPTATGLIVCAATANIARVISLF